MSSTLTDSQISREAEFGLFSLVHGDPLGRLIGHFAIRSRGTAVTLAALLSFSAAIFTTFEGSFVNNELSLDLLHDFGWWNQYLLAFPTLIYIAGSYFGAFPSTLKHLVDSGVLLADDLQWKKVRRFTNKKLSNSAFILLPYVCGFSAGALTYSVTQASGTWYDAEQYAAGLLIPAHAFFLYYFMTFLALRLYTAFLILKMLFSFKVNIQPFHEDGSGGLGSLMTQAEKLYLGMIIFGFIAAIAILSNTLVYNQNVFSVYNALFLMSYIVLTGVAYFIPLYALSSCMTDAKQKVLTTIRERHQLLKNSSSKPNKLQDGGDSVKKADLDALKTLRNIAKSMQVWPFNRTSFVRFVFAVTTPFLIIPVVLLFF